MPLLAALAAGLIAFAALIGGFPAAAYPKKPIELIVPFTAGGTTDNIARLISQRLTDRWGATVVVNNRPGSGGTIATGIAAKAPPDGHSLLVTTIGFAITPALHKLPYDPIKDFAPITELASLPLMLVVNASLPVNNFKEFVALARSKPGALDYASAGVGTSPHLAGEMFKTMAGVDLVHVPYKGNAEVTNAIIGGHVKVYFSLVPASLPHVKSGKMRVLAVTTAQRLPYLPDVPTIAELGFPAYEISSWQGMFAPAGTPKEVIGKINGEVVQMLNAPEVRARISREGADPVGSTPEQFAERVKSEIEKWSKVAKAAGLPTPK
ncbi:MAG: tripartite tricarboxylate transporter substrate binding protein [Xanthobacteraceae bacterium]